MNAAEFKVLRESLGLSTGYVAKLLGYKSERYVRRWEDGGAPIAPKGVELIERLSGAAEGSADELIRQALEQVGLDSVDDLDESVWPTLTVPRVDRDDLPLPASFYRACVFRAYWELGGHCWIKWDEFEDSP